jgi:hypothetical protein
VTVLATFPFFAWSVAVGIVTIRGRRPQEAVARQEVQPA